MSKKFNIRKWILSVKYWSLMFIPHISICFIFLIYILLGASIIQEIETSQPVTSSIANHSRNRLISKIIDKRQMLDVEKFTKYVHKHICQYEEEIRKKQYDFEVNSSWNFSKALFSTVTTLTTIGSTEFIPKTNLGKIFLMIYAGFGIPLTLVLLLDLAYIIKGFVNSISLVTLCFYSSKIFRYVRRLILFRSMKQRLNISIEDDERDEHLLTKLNSSITQQFFNKLLNILKTSNQKEDLTLIQLIITLFTYITIGAYFISTKSFLDSFYLCYTAIFTISLNKLENQKNNSLFISIYLIFGLALVLLFVKTLTLRLETLLMNRGKILVRHLLEFSQQIGAHNLRTDDIIPDDDIDSYPISDSIFSRHQHLIHEIPLEQQLITRSISVAEPLRRLSTDFIRALKKREKTDKKNVHKGVQVSTIIRRCNHCAELSLLNLPIRKHSVNSSSSSSMVDNSSSCEEDDSMELQAPNLDRIRKRRATLVAKTIIHQMAAQPRSSSIDEIISPLTFFSKQRNRSTTVTSPPIKCSVKISRSPSFEYLRNFDNNKQEFSEISKQISSLLTAHDD